MLDLSAMKHLVTTYSPATLSDIAAVEKELALVVPNVYQDFLLTTNGAESDLVALYGAESLIEMNQAYEVQEYAPGYISIGNDGGGYHLLMKAGESEKEFRMVSDGVGVPSDQDCTDVFEAWLFSDEGDPWRNRPTDGGFTRMKASESTTPPQAAGYVGYKR